MEEIKVSVIVPVYNAEKYLEECLESILNQTLKEIEIICVDDGSTDNSLKILENYQEKDKRIHLIKQNNLFAGVARNNGIKYASGKYLFFMDADDFCNKYLLEKSFHMAEKTQSEIVVFNYYKFDINSKQTEIRHGLSKSKLPIGSNIFSYVDIPNEICNIVNPTPWNKLFLKQFVIDNELKYIDTATTNDITFATLAVAFAKKIAFLDEALYYYRVNQLKNITSQKKNKLDNIIKAVLELDKQAHRLEYYNLIKNSIRLFVIKNLFVGLERYAGDNDSFQYIDYQKKIESIFYSYPLFIDLNNNEINNSEIFEEYSKFKSNAIARKDLRFLPRIIVSFTSYPKRINTIHKVIASILKQTVQPNKIILWLSEQNFPDREQSFPEKLIDYQKNYIDIEWVHDDIKSHKKYYYAFKKYPDDIIITIDDDLIYEKHMIENLIISYLKHPNCISAMRTHLIMQENNGDIAPYIKWKSEYVGLIDKPSMQLLATTGAGTLFPPHLLCNEVFNLEAIKSFCINADDIWLKVIQVISNIPVVLADNTFNLNFIDGTQEEALWYDNKKNNGNDIQLKNILNYYQEIYDINLIKKKIFQDISNSKALIRADNKIIVFINLLRKGYYCYKEHGAQYTLIKIKEKIRKMNIIN